MVDEELYRLMEDMGDSQVQTTYRKCLEEGKVAQTKQGGRLVAEAAGRVLVAAETHIKELTARHKKMEGDKRISIRNTRLLELVKFVGLEKAVAFSVRYMLDQVSRVGNGVHYASTIGALRTQLGNMLKEEADFIHLSRVNPGLYGYLRTRIQSDGRRRSTAKRNLQHLEEVKDCGWDREDRLLIAGFIMDYVMRFSDLFYTEIELDVPLRGPSKKLHVVKLREETYNWLQEATNFLAATRPCNLPITTRPYDWGPNQIGGYPGRKVHPIDMMTTKRRQQYSVFLESDCPLVYSGLNTIQSTRWRLNRKVFEVFQIAYRYEWDTIGLSPPPPPKPTPPDKEWVAGDPDWLKHKRARVAYEHLSRHYYGDQMSAGRSLAMGEIYQDLEFYYPHQIDYRGRCYPVGTPLSYQGPDWQRGLLEFAEGKPIGEGFPWFLVHGANCFGVDKVSFNERINWVNENRQNILQVSEDPIGFRWWTEADKPFQFLAWCLEFGEAAQMEDLGAFVSHLPISMDGSNNGLQIYSLMMRDPVGCAATNCVPTDSPADAYQQVADKVTAKLREISSDPTSDPTFARRARRVLDFLNQQGLSTLPRAAVKRPVMTQPYGATIYSCQSYMVEWYHDYVRGKNLTGDLAPFPEGDAYKIFQWVGMLVWDILGEVNPKAREAMTWLRDIADIVASHGAQIEWRTPLGMQCAQRYIKGQIKKITLKAFKPISIRVWNDDGRIDTRKARNGICPNFIHSFDAAAMFLTVHLASLEGATSFMMIHDSFGTHAADAPTMARCLREAYQTVLAGNPLESLREQLQSGLPEGVELPPPPAQGDLDLSTLAQADYFFA